MVNTADIRGLYDDETYSDIVVNGHPCHKCIVFPRSKTIKEVFAINSIVIDDDGTLELVPDAYDPDGWDIMVHAMYESDGSVVFGHYRPQEIANALWLGVQDGQSEFVAAAYSSLLPNGCRAMGEDEVIEVIEKLRSQYDDGTIQIADRLESAWMPRLLVNARARDQLSNAAIQRFLDSVEPRKKPDDTTENGSEEIVGFTMRIIEPTPPPPRIPLGKKATPKRAKKRRIAQVKLKTKTERRIPSYRECLSTYRA
jgi:hypothetical protein